MPATKWLAPYAKYSFLPIVDVVPDVPAFHHLQQDLLPTFNKESPPAAWQGGRGGPMFGSWAFLSQPAIEGLRNKPEDMTWLRQRA